MCVHRFEEKRLQQTTKHFNDFVLLRNQKRSVRNHEIVQRKPQMLGEHFNCLYMHIRFVLGHGQVAFVHSRQKSLRHQVIDLNQKRRPAQEVNCWMDECMDTCGLAQRSDAHLRK